MKNLKNLSRLGINSLFLLLIMILFGCGVKRIEKRESFDYSKLKSKQILHYYKKRLDEKDSLFIKKIKGEFKTAEESRKFKGYLKWIKNKELQLSIIPLLGIEAFRCYFNTDSVFIIDKINKTFRRGSYDDLSKRLDYTLDFAFIEDIFVKGLPYNELYKRKISNKYPLVEKEFARINFIEKDIDLYNLALILNKENINHLLFEMDKKAKYAIYGSVFYNKDYTIEKLDFKFKSDKHEAFLEMKYNNFYKGKFNIRFRKPKGYKHIKL